MNYFLTKYGMEICQDRLSTGIPEMPRSETKVQPNSFFTNYTKTLGIEEEMIGVMRQRQATLTKWVSRGNDIGNYNNINSKKIVTRI